MSYGPNHYSNLGGAAAAVIKPAPAFVYSITCHNENAADRWFMLFNQKTTPQAGDIPKIQFLVGAGQQIGRGTDVFREEGVRFDVGLSWGFSTTKDTFTAGTATEQSSDVFYA